MDIGDVGFILMNKREKQVLHELCQVLLEFLTCISNLAFSLRFGIDKDSGWEEKREVFSH